MNIIWHCNEKSQLVMRGKLLRLICYFDVRIFFSVPCEVGCWGCHTEVNASDMFLYRHRGVGLLELHSQFLCPRPVDICDEWNPCSSNSLTASHTWWLLHTFLWPVLVEIDFMKSLILSLLSLLIFEYLSKIYNLRWVFERNAHRRLDILICTEEMGWLDTSRYHSWHQTFQQSADYALSNALLARWSCSEALSRI